MSRRATFWNILCACWTELQNPGVSATSLKSDFVADDLKPILKFSKQAKEIFAVELSFRIGGGGGGGGVLDSSNFLKGTLLKMIL